LQHGYNITIVQDDLFVRVCIFELPLGDICLTGGPSIESPRQTLVLAGVLHLGVPAILTVGGARRRSRPK
jgi:hypothetical protein